MSKASDKWSVQSGPGQSTAATGNRLSVGMSRGIQQVAGSRVFVAMPFGTKSAESKNPGDRIVASSHIGKKIRIDFDSIWKRLIRPALEQAGCRPYRADEEPGAGDIRTDMYFELVTGEFVLADISTLNANVFYELGVRHGVSPRGVLMIDGGWDRRPFDVAPDRTFSYKGSLFELGADPDDPLWAKEVGREVDALAAQLQAAVANDVSTTSSPVYKELRGLKPADWSEIQNAKARYFGNQLQEWSARVSKARRRSYVGDILTLSCDAPNRFTEWQLRLDAAHALIDLGRYERARELLRAMVTEKPTCSESRYALAKTLACLARGAEHPQMVQEYQARAEQEIEEALNSGGDTPEAHLLLGRIYKHRWRNRWENAEGEEERKRLAIQYLEFAKKGLSHYREALMWDLSCLHAGLNLVSLSCLCTRLAPDETIEKVADLEDVIGLVRMAARRTLLMSKRHASATKTETEQIWAIASLAETALLTVNPDEAGKLYRRVATHPDVSISQLKSFDDQLEMYEKLGIEKESVQHVRRYITAQLDAQVGDASGILTDTLVTSLPGIFVFKGGEFHGKKKEEQGVRHRLRKLLQEQWHIQEGDVVICGAQQGIEIILAEESVELKANVRLVLPLNKAEFINRFVRRIGPGWDKRFYKLMDKCEVLEQPLRLGVPPVDLNPYDRNDIWCLDMARTEFGPYVRPRVISLSIGENENQETILRDDRLVHYEQCARHRDLLVEKVVVWGYSEETTLIFPACNMVMFVHWLNGKVDALPLLKEVRMGRSDKNDVVLKDRRISRYHLKLTPVEEGLQLTNLSEHPNTTFLNDEAMAPLIEETPVMITSEQIIRLPDGTRITFKDRNTITP
ncbi:MAG: FHA domain-containing protein [Gammaproteobacteria bacterium]|nr:FHA domain-containing protein [Gammaproteobacteria bacterium]